MPYADGTWGKKAKERSKKRAEYFREYTRKRKGKRSLTDFDMFSRKGIGAYGEFVVRNLLPDCEWVNLPSHDIEHDNNKIEIKTARERKHDPNSWEFSFTPNQLNIDFAYLVCVTGENNVVAIYKVPHSFFQLKDTGHKTSRVVRGGGKYDRFLIEKPDVIRALEGA